MRPGFRHRNRPTKMHDKEERCFYLNSGNGHSSDTHKVITPAGIATYSAHCTFGYRRQAFQGEVPTWRGVLLPLRGRGRLRRLGGCSSRVFIGTGTGGVGSSARGGDSSHVFIGSCGYVSGCGDIFPWRGYSRGGSSGGGDRWHTCKWERSPVAGGSGCVAYATRIRPFRWSWSSYRRTFSDGAGAGAAYRWHTCKRDRSRTAGGSGCVAYATHIRPFRLSWGSYRRTFSDEAGAGAAGGKCWAQRGAS